MTKATRYIAKHKIKFSILLVMFIWYYFLLPKTLFNNPTATVIESTEGELLGAKIASDMQWRFPPSQTVPDKFSKCITTYEDAYFYKHWGFNPVSIYKAFKTNWKAGKIVRGGSTLTQQVIRLSRHNKKRSYYEKIIELILATRLEFRASKEDILSLYASHAPFGGNIVGLEAAAWKYFGQQPENLSWAEQATLAVLPNAPGMIHLNKNRTALMHKRNKLLSKLVQEQIIDSLTFQLAIQEELPNKTYALPQIAPHLLEKIRQQHEGEKVQTSIHYNLQKQVNQIVKQHYNQLKQNHIYNASVLVIRVKDRKALAYVGNTPTDKSHQKDVDIIDKPRSTGSILKPFLYSSMLSAGDILPHTLIADIPTKFAEYQPQNFGLEFYGAVPASKALAKSLNIPAVRMLQTYGLNRFYHDLKKLKLESISKGADHYGLSLILGGAESNLWELCRAYTSLASTLNHYDTTQGEYYTNEFTSLSLLKRNNPDFGKTSTEYPIYDAGSIFTTFLAMRELNRPEGEENWEFFDNTKTIAWKTGTSFGFRDAWAIGVTTDYVVGVWVGNADGEGRPGLTGITTAAPILFDVFNELPKTKWFAPPYDELTQITTCRKSGFINTEYCEETDSVWVPTSGLKTKPCPFHHLVHLDSSESFQVNASCENLERIVHKNWFSLPPLQAYYYQLKNPTYKVLPPFKKDCLSDTEKVMEFVDDSRNQNIFLPKDFNGDSSSLIIKVKHQQINSVLFWYLDSQYISTTTGVHEISLQPEKGEHILLIMDNNGHELKKTLNFL